MVLRGSALFFLLLRIALQVGPVGWGVALDTNTLLFPLWCVHCHGPVGDVVRVLEIFVLLQLANFHGPVLFVLIIFVLLLRFVRFGELRLVAAVRSFWRSSSCCCGSLVLLLPFQLLDCNPLLYCKIVLLFRLLLNPLPLRPGDQHLIAVDRSSS